MLFASWPVPDTPPGTSSNGDSDPASSSDDSSVTPRYIQSYMNEKNFEKKKNRIHIMNKMCDKVKIIF